MSSRKLTDKQELQQCNIWQRLTNNFSLIKLNKKSISLLSPETIHRLEFLELKLMRDTPQKIKSTEQVKIRLTIYQKSAIEEYSENNRYFFPLIK